MHATGHCCTRLWQALRSSQQRIELRQLTAYMTYSVHVEACTVAGCARGPAVSLTTSGDLPRNLSAAVVDNITASSVHLSWTDPHLPNGRVER